MDSAIPRKGRPYSPAFSASMRVLIATTDILVFSAWMYSAAAVTDWMSSPWRLADLEVSWTDSRTSTEALDMSLVRPYPLATCWQLFSAVRAASAVEVLISSLVRTISVAAVADSPTERVSSLAFSTCALAEMPISLISSTESWNGPRTLSIRSRWRAVVALSCRAISAVKALSSGT